MSRRPVPLNVRKKNHFAPNGEPIPGVCVVCGCEEDNACPEGCWWLNDRMTLCSVCADKLGVEPQARIRRDISIMRDQIDEAAALKKRSVRGDAEKSHRLQFLRRVSKTLTSILEGTWQPKR